jgi:hypothetical protein
VNKLSLILMIVGTLNLSGSVHAKEGGSAGGGNNITISEEGASGGGAKFKIRGTDSGGGYIAPKDFKEVERVDDDSIWYNGLNLNLNLNVISWEWPKKN